jgi:Asp-tRNA(Asn)/Glu-tRNA(Gln) amidotransferase C subunit
MATKTTQEILDDINEKVALEPSLAGLSMSKTAINQLLYYVCAQQISEDVYKLSDVLRAELDKLGLENVSLNNSWWRNRFLEFQYSLTSPQNIVVDDGKTVWPVVDESLRIITRISVSSPVPGTNSFKVAKNDGSGGLEKLDSDEQQAAQKMANDIGGAGMPGTVVTLDSDKLKVSVTITKNGAFADSLIIDNVRTSLNAYYESLSTVSAFNGFVEFNGVNDAIQASNGVISVDTQNMTLRLRPDNATPGDDDNKLINQQAETAAGYVVEETNGGELLEDTLTIIS